MNDDDDGFPRRRVRNVTAESPSRESDADRRIRDLERVVSEQSREIERLKPALITQAPTAANMAESYAALSPGNWTPSGLGVGMYASAPVYVGSEPHSAWMAHAGHGMAAAEYVASQAQCQTMPVTAPTANAAQYYPEAGGPVDLELQGGLGFRRVVGSAGV